MYVLDNEVVKECAAVIVANIRYTTASHVTKINNAHIRMCLEKPIKCWVTRCGLLNKYLAVIKHIVCIHKKTF